MSPRIRAVLAKIGPVAAPIARDLGGIAGAGLIIAGVAQFSAGIAMIVAGALMVAAALKLARNG